MEQSRRVSLQDIATEAGVSRQTVSIALRNHPSIPSETRQRIQQVAARLGYRANAIVSTVMASVRAPAGSHFMGTLAFVTSHRTRRGWRHPVFEGMFAGAAHRARELGYGLEEFWFGDPATAARRFQTVLHARGIRGLIIAPVPRPGMHLSLDWSKFAAVALGYSLYRPNLDRISSHQYHAALLALRHLNRLGYRRIGLAMEAEVNKRTDYNWMSGCFVFQQGLRASERVPMLVAKQWDAAHFARWFNQHHPEVVVGGREVFGWLQQLGYRVPSDVGFVTLDRHDTGKRAAGIDQRPELVGAESVDLLTAKLHRHERGIPADPKVVLIECKWVDGPTVRVMPRAQRGGKLGRVPSQK